MHVYFPDPWWKKRHKKRRVFTDALVAQVERVLQPGGELHVASDVEEYFTLIRELIAASPRFRERPVPEPKDPEHELDYLTNFERKYRLEGRPIYRAIYDYRAPPTPELLAEWLLPVVDLKLEPGAEFTLRSQPQPGWDGIVNCRLLELEAGEEDQLPSGSSATSTPW